MYQAITTKYLGATNKRGSRVKATAAGGSVTWEWDDGDSTDGNHIRAAKMLATKMGWRGWWFGGVNHDGHHVFVNIDHTFQHAEAQAAFQVKD